MIRYYITPMIGDGLTPQTARRPKYSSRIYVSSRTWEAIDFGLEAVCIFAAEVTEAEHLVIAALSEVIVFPENLDIKLGSTAVSRVVKEKLEAYNIPANWVNASDSYRNVLHVVGGMFMFMQRLNGLMSMPLFGNGVTMETKFNTLPSDVQTAVIAAAQSLGYETTLMSTGVTIRQALKFLADSWGDTPIYFFGTQL